MTVRRPSSRAVALLTLTVSLALGGCARAGDTLGAGEDVDFCAGWGEVLNLDEPALDERDDVLRWAEGVRRIIDRIDLRIEVDDEPIPQAVEAGLETADDTIRRFVGDVRDSTSVADVRAAQRDLADSAWDDSAAALTRFRDVKCR